MRHMLIIGPRKSSTSCGLRIAAHYPNSRTALPVRELDGYVIDVSQAIDDVDCPICRAQLGLDPIIHRPKSAEALANDCP